MEKEALLQSMFDHATVGIIMANSAGEIVDVNFFANKIFGYSEGELIGKRIEVLVPSAAHSQHVKYRDKYFHHPKPRPMGEGRELFGVKKNGEEFPVEISLSFAIENEERLAIAFVSDTSVRKSMLASLRKNEQELQKYSDRLEQKVMERTRELTASETRLREAQRMANLGYWEYDLTNRTFTISEVLPVIFGLPRSQETEVDAYLSRLHSEDLASAKRMLRSALKSRQRHEYSYRILAQDGSLKYIQGYVEREEEEATGIVKLFGISQDITAYKMAEAQMAQSLQKERELGELKSRFVAMASHEFKTPLTAILSSTDIIDVYAERLQTDKLDRHVKRIRSSVNNLNTILNDFLSLEKLESGSVSYHPRQVDVPVYFAEVLDDILLSGANRQRITLRHTGPAEALLDAQLIRNVLNNLVSNAIKYSAAETPIVIASKRTVEQLQIDVIDQGMGIPLVDQPNMFNRFFRASNAESIKGTGLGLNIVKRYVGIMGGEVSFTSEEGKGTTFTITIPQ